MNGKALSHDKNWYLGSSRVRVVSQDHLTTTYQVEVTSPAVLQVAGIRWPLPCLPQAVIKVCSNHFHQQFKVIHPSLPEDIRKFSLATFYLCQQAKACYWSPRAPKICQATGLCLEQRRHPAAAPPPCLLTGGLETLNSTLSASTGDGHHPLRRAWYSSVFTEMLK